MDIDRVAGLLGHHPEHRGEQHLRRIGFVRKAVRANGERSRARFKPRAQDDQSGPRDVGARQQEGGRRMPRQLPVEQDKLRLELLKLAREAFEVRAFRNRVRLVLFDEKDMQGGADAQVVIGN